MAGLSGVSTINEHRQVVGAANVRVVPDKNASSFRAITGKSSMIDNTAPLDNPNINDKDAIATRINSTFLASMATDPNAKTVEGYVKNSELSDVMDVVHKTVNLPTAKYNSYSAAFKQSAEYYNRFKIPNPNEYLMRGVPHVFFVRPSCNILSSGKLVEGLENNEKFLYAYKSCPELLRELAEESSYNHDFMLTLSNHIVGFPLNAEFINTDTYGRTYTGYKIAYGKNNVESKTASNLELTFNDDRNLHIYQIHQLWVEYINGVYRGMIMPRKEMIYNKILDYTAACYYFLTAEDGETIIYWCKFYGLFPTNAPSDQLSWGAGNFITAPQISVSYMYSFKEEYNPRSIMEFNYNSKVKTNEYLNYAPTFDENLSSVGNTWVGTPFIESISNGKNGQPFTYKLRFRSKEY